MEKKVIEGTWEKERAFSPAVITTGGTTIWLAGHGGLFDDDRNMLTGDFGAQVRRSFKNIERTLDRAGGTLHDIVTMTVFITDVRHGDEFIKIRHEYYPKDPPASALITITGFARPEMLVEICPIAVIDDD